MKDLVSVVVPVYNVQEYLARCIESIINQTYKDLEIILVDDGSTDDSANIMKHYGSLDTRIINIFKENFGAPSARNRGIDIATGKYIMFFDSDDELYPNAIEDMVTKMNDADVIMGNWSYIDLNNHIMRTRKDFENQIYQKEDLANVIVLNPFPGNKLYKKEIIKDNKLYFDNVRIGQDLNFYIKYTALCNKFATTENLVFKYRITDNSIARTYNLNILDIVRSIENANRFLEKNNKPVLDITIINTLKVIAYEEQLKKIFNYNKRDSEIIRLYFYEELKKLDVSNCPSEIKELYNKMMIRCNRLKIMKPQTYNKMALVKRRGIGKIKRTIKQLQEDIIYKLPKACAHKMIYKKKMNKVLNLKNPRDLNEKIQYMMVYKYGKKEGELSDKNQVKQYVLEKNIENLFIPKTLKIYQNASEINLDELPEQFVLKCNHFSRKGRNLYFKKRF